MVAIQSPNILTTKPSISTQGDKDLDARRTLILAPETMTLRPLSFQRQANIQCQTFRTPRLDPLAMQLDPVLPTVVKVPYGLFSSRPRRLSPSQ